jgi:hypothetical protein
MQRQWQTGLPLSACLTASVLNQEGEHAQADARRLQAGGQARE